MWGALLAVSSDALVRASIRRSILSGRERSVWGRRKWRKKDWVHGSMESSGKQKEEEMGGGCGEGGAKQMFQVMGRWSEPVASSSRTCHSVMSSEAAAAFTNMRSRTDDAVPL